MPLNLAQSTNVIPQKMVTPDFGSFADTINQNLNIQKNRVELEKIQQSLLSNKAVSEAMIQSINPDTNEIDQNKLLSLLARDPRAAYNLPEIANKVNLN